MKHIKSKLGALALASLSVASTITHARAATDTAYNPNDLLLFFQNPGGNVGTDKVLYFSLGNVVSVFRDATATQTTLGDLIGPLNQVYSSDWTGSKTSIFAGAAGQSGSTDALSTEITNGDYARTVYVTKPRAGAGTLGQANSASPLFSPTYTAVASNIAGSNNILGMTQPGNATIGNTLLDNYNPFSNGNPSTAYGYIAGGIQGAMSNSTYTLGGVTQIVLGLDLYRVTKTSGTNSASTSVWHISQNKTATTTGSFTGNSTARADFLGTIYIQNTGAVGYLAASTSTPTPTQPPSITSAATINGTVGTPFIYTITGSNSPTSFAATGLPGGLSINTSTGVISGNPTTAGTTPATISATNAGGTGSGSLTITINSATPPSGGGGGGAPSSGGGGGGSSSSQVQKKGKSSGAKKSTAKKSSGKKSGGKKKAKK
jgi:hypothetical protein